MDMRRSEPRLLRTAVALSLVVGLAACEVRRPTASAPSLAASGGVAHPSPSVVSASPSDPPASPVSLAALRGTITYWAVNTGQLMKIAPGAASPVVMFDSGPADQLGAPAPANYNGAFPPWESGGGNKRCVACHTVSKDGSTVAAWTSP